MERDSSERSRKPWAQRASKVFWAIVGVLILVVFPLFIWSLMFDSVDQEWVSCEVTDATSSKGNRFNSSDWIVAIETTDCGRITYTEGISEGNVEDVASSFDPGEYEFKFGITSRLAADGWIPFVQANAHEYRPAD